MMIVVARCNEGGIYLDNCFLAEIAAAILLRCWEKPPNSSTLTHSDRADIEDASRPTPRRMDTSRSSKTGSRPAARQPL